MPRPVVITRPLAQARALQLRVQAQGRSGILLPLLRILPLEATQQALLQAYLCNLQNYALVAFVSPNAIEAACCALAELGLAWPSQVSIAVMGEGSRAALAQHAIGAARVYCPTNPARSDSQGLLQELNLEELRNRKVLIVRGQHGRELLADELRLAQVKVETVAAYQRLAPVPDTEFLDHLLTGLRSPHHWLISSSESLRYLLKILEDMQAKREDVRAEFADIVVKMKQQHLILPHARIAETAQSLGFSQITLSAAGDEGLLAALQSQP